MTKSENNTIVLVGGCFDILHAGHIQFLKKAKALGNYLVVALESDINIKKLKGEKRPIHYQKYRRQILESLGFVDKVIILGAKMEDKDYFKLVKKVAPSIIAVTKGDPLLEKKKEQAKIVSASVVEIPRIEGFSTSRIISNSQFQFEATSISAESQKAK